MIFVTLINYYYYYYYYFLSNARDTTYFTTKCLQTDVASKVEAAMLLK